MLEDLVDKIVVHEAIGKKPNRQQSIDIYFNFIGKFDLAYTQKELEELQSNAKKKEEEKQQAKIQRQRNTIQRHREKKKLARLAENDGHIFAKSICEHCGTEYYPNSSRQRFCCSECKEQARKKKVAKERFEEKGNHIFKEKICQICGESFYPSNGREVLCSKKCKDIKRKERQLTYYYSKKDEVKQDETV